MTKKLDAYTLTRKRNRRQNTATIRRTRSGTRGQKACRQHRDRAPLLLLLPLLLPLTMAKFQSTTTVRLGTGEVSNVVSGRFVWARTLPTFRGDERDGNFFGFVCKRKIQKRINGKRASLSPISFVYVDQKIEWTVPGCGVYSPKYPPMVVVRTTASIARQIMIMIFFCARHQCIGKNIMIDYQHGTQFSGSFLS